MSFPCPPPTCSLIPNYRPAGTYLELSKLGLLIVAEKETGNMGHLRGCKKGCITGSGLLLDDAGGD